MVINVRGTSGSGKTTVMREIMSQSTSTQPIILDGQKKPDAYLLNIPSVQHAVFLVGSYENVCGGCDAIATQDEICARVRNYSKDGHVLFEGLLMSHVFSRYAALDRELAARGVPSIWAFLDTPLELCLARVNDRRVARGQLEPVNPVNTSDKWAANRSTFDKFVKPASKNWKDVNKFLKTWGLPQVDFPYPVLGARWLGHEGAAGEVLRWLQE